MVAIFKELAQAGCLATILGAVAVDARLQVEGHTAVAFPKWNSNELAEHNKAFFDGPTPGFFFSDGDIKLQNWAEKFAGFGYKFMKSARLLPCCSCSCSSPSRCLYRLGSMLIRSNSFRRTY